MISTFFVIVKALFEALVPADIWIVMIHNTVDQADDAGQDHLAELLALHRDSLPHQQTQAGHLASKPS